MKRVFSLPKAIPLGKPTPHGSINSDRVRGPELLARADAATAVLGCLVARGLGCETWVNIVDAATCVGSENALGGLWTKAYRELEK